MKIMEKHLQRAAQQCQEQGSNLTIKRKKILSTLLIAQKAVSAYELIDLYESSFDDKITAMSVYRILAYLEEMHLVHKLKIVNKFVACTHINGNGHHSLSQFLFCQQCESVEEIPISTSVYNELFNKIEQSGYQLCSQQIELSCVCHDCSTSTKLITSNEQIST